MWLLGIIIWEILGIPGYLLMHRFFTKIGAPWKMFEIVFGVIGAVVLGPVFIFVYLMFLILIRSYRS